MYTVVLVLFVIVLIGDFVSAVGRSEPKLFEMIMRAFMVIAFAYFI
jgi:hypothetical protein